MPSLIRSDYLSYNPRAHFSFIYVIFVKTQNQLTTQLSSTEFEVRLRCHMYIHHPTTQELSMLLLLLTAQSAAGRDLYVQLYSHTQVSATLHI